MPWAGKHYAIIVEDLFKSEESYTAAIQNFKNHYKLSIYNHVPT